MDVFDDELIRFWTALNKYGVKYIMVKAANRPKDQVDIIYLEKIRQLMENDPDTEG